MSGTWADAGLRVVWTDFPEKVALPQVLSATLLLDLEADTLALNDGDPVSVWADQSGNGHDFTQTGNERPIKQTVGEYPVVLPDGINDWMLGGDFADNSNSFAVFHVGKRIQQVSDETSVIQKINDSTNDSGWALTSHSFFIQTDSINYLYKYYSSNIPDLPNPFILNGEILNVSTINLYLNGSDTSVDASSGVLSSFSNLIPVKLFTWMYSEVISFSNITSYAILIYKINNTDNWAVDRAAITAWLAARYGITL